MIVVQEMRLVFPNSHRINRGNYVVKELADACRANDITDLIVLHEHRGIPGELRPGTVPTLDSKLFRCVDRFPFSPWSDSSFYTSQCRPSPRYWLIQIIHRIRTIPTSYIRAVHLQTWDADTGCP